MGTGNLNETLRTFLNQFSKFFPLGTVQFTGSSWFLPCIFKERAETDTLIVITCFGKVGGVIESLNNYLEKHNVPICQSPRTSIASLDIRHIVIYDHVKDRHYCTL